MERPVDLERADAVAVALERLPEADAEPVAGDREQRPRREIQEHRARAGQIVDVVHTRPGDDLAAERPQQRRQRVADPLRATFGTVRAAEEPEIKTEPAPIEQVSLQKKEGTLFYPLQLAPRMQTGAHLPHPRISQRSGRRIEIFSDRPLPLEIDGERRGRATHVTVEVQPGAYRLLV